MKQTQKLKTFTQWFKEKYKVEILFYDKKHYPKLWKKFLDSKAFAIKGKYIFFNKLNEVAETEALKKSLGDKFASTETVFGTVASWFTDSQIQRVLWHELVHIKRQRKLSWFVFLMRYAFSQKFRRNEEIRAYTWTLEYLFFVGKDPSAFVDYYTKIILKSYLINDKHETYIFNKLQANCEKIKKHEIRNVHIGMNTFMVER